MRIAIVTGASSGIGREFARQIGNSVKGVDEIWLVARREGRLRRLAGELPLPARVLPCDLTSPDGTKPLRNLLEQKRPRVSLLVNCAGFGKFGRCSEISDADNLDMVNLNCRALLEVTQLASPYLGKGSHILQMASTSSFQPLPGMAVYAASKAFVTSYSRALAAELRPRGVTVTAVCAGWVDTDFFRVARETENPGAVHRYLGITTPDKVVRCALRAAFAGKDICVPGLFNKAHRLAAKLLPAHAVMAAWEWMQD